MELRQPRPDRRPVDIADPPRLELGENVSAKQRLVSVSSLRLEVGGGIEPPTGELADGRTPRLRVEPLAAVEGGQLVAEPPVGIDLPIEGLGVPLAVGTYEAGLPLGRRSIVDLAIISLLDLLPFTKARTWLNQDSCALDPAVCSHPLHATSHCLVANLPVTPIVGIAEVCLYPVGTSSPLDFVEVGDGRGIDLVRCAVSFV